jgi:hypothetical protein
MPLRLPTRRAGLAAALLIPAALALAPTAAHADDDDLGTITVERAFIGNGTNLFVEGTYSCDPSVKEPQIYFATHNKRTRVTQIGMAYQKKRFVLRCDGEMHDWVGSTPNVSANQRYRVRDKIIAAAIMDDVGQTPRQRVRSVRSDDLSVARL